MRCVCVWEGGHTVTVHHEITKKNHQHFEVGCVAFNHTSWSRTTLRFSDATMSFWRFASGTPAVHMKNWTFRRTFEKSNGKKKREETAVISALGSSKWRYQRAQEGDDSSLHVGDMTCQSQLKTAIIQNEKIPVLGKLWQVISPTYRRLSPLSCTRLIVLVTTTKCPNKSCFALFFAFRLTCQNFAKMNIFFWDKLGYQCKKLKNSWLHRKTSKWCWINSCGFKELIPLQNVGRMVFWDGNRIGRIRVQAIRNHFVPFGFIRR